MPAKITERVAWGGWDGDRPTATPADVAHKTDAMYGQYLTTPTTQAEAETGLRLALEQKGLPAAA
jgi:hypothetical protein